MTENAKLRGIRIPQRRHQRVKNKELWVNAPLQNTIRAAIEARGWSISDLARALNSQSSLVSRWMMGARPNTESIVELSQVLGLDVHHLLVLSGHIPPSAAAPTDERVAMLQNKLTELEMTDERFAMLNGLIETMRQRQVSDEPPLAEQARRKHPA